MYPFPMGLVKVTEMKRERQTKAGKPEEGLLES